MVCLPKENSCTNIWDNEADRAAYEAWERTEPPTGEGWQMWETVTEGSPQTPVFATAEGLVDYLVHYKDYSRSDATKFVKSGWVPSAIMKDGMVLRDIESAEVLG